jgi:hypothetical protein
MSQSLAESAFITEKNINNHENMLTIFYVLTMMDQVDGKIENNTLTYNIDKYDQIKNKDEISSSYTPFIDKFLPDNIKSYLQLNNYYIYVKHTPIQRKITIQPIKEETIPDKIELHDFNKLKKETSKVIYAIKLHAFYRIGKDINKSEILLNKMDKEKLILIHEESIIKHKDFQNYKLCMGTNFIDNVVENLTFKNNNYQILSSGNCI